MIKKIENENDDASTAENKSSATNARDPVEVHAASIKEAMIGADESMECVTSTAVRIAMVKALKDANDKGDPGMGGRKDPNLPLTPGRLAFEAVYNQHKQPWAWNNLKPEGHKGKYVNPVRWLGTVMPSNWNQMQKMMDKDGNPILDEKGKPKMEPVNEDRRAYPNAVFLTPRRLQMYKDLILAAAEPMYIALWAIKIGCARWIDAELIISLDPYWSGVYEKEFGPFSKGVHDAMQDMGRDSGSLGVGEAAA